MLVNVFKYLNYYDLQSVSLVCRKFFSACQCPTLQSNILLNIKDIDANNQVENLFLNTNRYFTNLCLDSCNIGSFFKILNKLGEHLSSVTFKNITFLNCDQFYHVLQYFKKLKNLTIFNCLCYEKQRSENISDVNLKILSNLRELHLKEIDCDSWPLFHHIGKYLKKMEILEVSEYFYHTNHASRYQMILDVIEQNYKSLKELTIKDIEDLSFWMQLAKIEKFCDSLIRFNCEYVCWETDTEMIFSHFIENQKNLIELNLGQSKALRNQDLIFISKNLKDLKILNLDFCTKITDESAIWLHELKHLEDLTIYECDGITSIGITNGIAKQKNTKLKKLRMSGLDIDSNCVELICKNLPELEVLVIIYPKHNDIGDVSMQAINTNLLSLKELCLEGCNMITDYGFTGYNFDTNIQEGISINNLKNLEFLDLCFCSKLTDFSIINGFQFRKLQRCSLGFVPDITNKAMEILIKNCPLIEILDFQNSFEIDELLDFAFKNLKRLTNINISRVCPGYIKNKTQFACVDLCKNENSFIHIECSCRICENAKQSLIFFKGKPHLL